MASRTLASRHNKHKFILSVSEVVSVTVLLSEYSENVEGFASTVDRC